LPRFARRFFGAAPSAAGAAAFLAFLLPAFFLVAFFLAAFFLPAFYFDAFFLPAIGLPPSAVIRDHPRRRSIEHVHTLVHTKRIIVTQR
jgi:hypothetical protein